MERLIYKNPDGTTFTRVFSCDLGCENCSNNDHCYVDGQIPGLGDGCPLIKGNLVSRMLITESVGVSA